jgi:hypothetical protein
VDASSEEDVGLGRECDTGLLVPESMGAGGRVEWVQEEERQPSTGQQEWLSSAMAAVSCRAEAAACLEALEQRMEGLRERRDHVAQVVIEEGTRRHYIVTCLS